MAEQIVGRRFPSRMSDFSVSDTPLRLGRSKEGRVVVVYTPSGERVMLSAAAAMLSARDLARAARVAARAHRRDGSIVRVRFDQVRHFPQRRWQAFRARLHQQGLRRLVAALLLPIGLSLSTPVIVWGAVAILGREAALALGLLLIAAAVLLALAISWIVAPLVMSRDELAVRPPLGSRPRLAASRDCPG